MQLHQVFDSARELTLGAATTASRLVDTAPPDDVSIRRMLNSASDREKESGMRAILDQIAEGKDAHAFFAEVVKNVQSRDLTVREMVAAFLVLYSDRAPELSLMAVNSVQRMLGDASAVVRLQAIRLVSALRVATVAPIVTHFLRDLANDVSPIVRIACCQAAGKCRELDPSLSADLLEIVTAILRSPRQTNGEYGVAGWALAVIAWYWPQRMDVIHSVYRTYVPQLATFEEWCQIPICRMLVRYCRHYMRGPQDRDCRLFVDALEPLLLSSNDAVVIEAAAALSYVGTKADFGRVKAAGRVLALTPTAAVWSSIASLCSLSPEQFRPYRAQIILGLTPQDPPPMRAMALKTAVLCGGSELRKAELAHLKFCALAWQDDQESVRAAMETLASLCGSSDAPVLARWLISLASSSAHSPTLMSEALMVLRVLVQQHKLAKAASTLSHLAVIATNDRVLPAAKSTIVWLLGTHCTDQPALATDLLRRCLLSMASEATEVRLEILQLAAKVYNAYRNDASNFDERVPRFFAFAVHLSRYDPDVDVRDRARMFGALMSQEDNAMATLLLQTVKPPPLTSDLGVSDQQRFTVDTASAYFNKRLDGYVDLEPWGAEDTSAVRDAEITAIATEEHGFAASATASSSTKQMSQVPSTTSSVKKMSLEEFLDTPEESGSSSASDEEDSDENESGESASERGVSSTTDTTSSAEASSREDDQNVLS